ncbi:MAG: substrate-binding domain-containing protein [Alphaproteobacteria bacterium]|nr:MAG: substrate-binding domain-containing protein [Alphaproteobacteria bacterium]
MIAFSQIFLCLLAVFTALCAQNGSSRHTPNVITQSHGKLVRTQVRITGSTTLFPLVLRASEEFSSFSSFPMPLIMNPGTNRGINHFCSARKDIGYDILMASREMTPVDLKTCHANGFNRITKISLGRDGIALVTHKKNLALSGLTHKELFRALASKVPDGSGALIPNPHMTWADINPQFPPQAIRILVPSANHGTRDALFAHIFASSNQKNSSLRTDGAIIVITPLQAADEHDLFFQALRDNPETIGIVGSNLWEAQRSDIRAIPFNGISPTKKAIRTGTYPLSRGLFLYVHEERSREVLSMKDFLGEITSRDACGTKGYLTMLGLIPLASGNGSLRTRVLE